MFAGIYKFLQVKHGHEIREINTNINEITAPVCKNINVKLDYVDMYD